jgi:hypothetical protein
MGNAGRLFPKLMQKLGLRERLRETEMIEAWSKIVGDFIAAHSTPVALREGVLYVRLLQPAVHYEFEQINASAAKTFATFASASADLQD